MNGNTQFEHRGSDHDTATYQTYDERSVSRDEINRAVRMAHITFWLSSPIRLAALTFAVTAFLGLALWLVASVTRSHAWASWGSVMHAILIVASATLTHPPTLILILTVPALVFVLGCIIRFTRRP